MAGATILLVEDDPAIADAIVLQLTAEGHRVDHRADGHEAARVDPDAYDLVVLDLSLPGLSGTELCRRWRLRSTVPILIVTASGGETDRVLGLEIGADDYLTKPFSMRELLARFRALLRRRELDRCEPAPLVRSVDGLQLDFARRRATVDGRHVSLTPLEFDIVALLAGEPGRVFPRRRIVEHLWKTGGSGNERACDVHIKNIRQKIERDPAHPELVLTVRGVGYLLRPPVTPPI